MPEGSRQLDRAPTCSTTSTACCSWAAATSIPRPTAAKPDRHLYGVNDVRDAFELALVPRRDRPRHADAGDLSGRAGPQRRARRRARPAHHRRAGLLGHGIPGVEGGAALHEVEIDAGSAARRGDGRHRAPSARHTTTRPSTGSARAPGTARAPTASSRASSSTATRGSSGAQWHPEDTAGRDPVQQALFDTFVSEAAPGVSSRPTLETDRLRLRAWRDDDLDAYAALCADPEVMRWHGRTARRRPARSRPSSSPASVVTGTTTASGSGARPLAGDDTCIGFIGLATPDVPARGPAIGRDRVAAGPGRAGATGTRPRVPGAAMAYAFDTSAWTGSSSITRPENRNSWNVMQKLGMTLERTTTHPGVQLRRGRLRDRRALMHRAHRSPS